MALHSSRWRDQQHWDVEREVLLDEGQLKVSRRPETFPHRRRWCLVITVSILLLAGLVIAFYLLAKHHDKGHEPYTFKSAVVAADSKLCSSVGSSILRRGGNAVDAAIATLLCGNLGCPQSMGIGGGFFMTIYNKTTGESAIIDARETAPGNATEDMFEADHSKSSRGGLSIGVPGELKGYWKAHQKYGSLPWRELFEPTIQLAAEGFPVSIGLGKAIIDAKLFLATDPSFRRIFYNSETGQLFREGETMKMALLAKTLRAVADEGADAFYNGSLTDAIMGDLRDAGSIITRDDLLNYGALVKEPLEIALGNGHQVLSPPPPSSGAVLSFMLNILDGYNFSPEDLESTEARTLTYHRVIEAFKFAYAKRTDLGDEDFVNVTELVKNLTSGAYADEIRSRITDNMTHNMSYYDPTFYDRLTTSTSHLSIVDTSGSAVSVTSTINGRFGSHVLGARTGIIFNNEMDDFSSPNITNIYHVPPSPANFIRPGKRPLSSMCPAVIVGLDNHVVGVYGAAGGSLITSATAWVIIHDRWLGDNVRKAVERPRLHHQLLPPFIMYEESFKEQAVLEGLEAKGHALMSYPVGMSIVQAIESCDGVLCAYSDPRKGGIPEGF